MALGVCALPQAQSAALDVERHGDHLRLSAPGFHFVAGAPLDRLHDGISVTYALSVRMAPERGDHGPVIGEQHFLVSYDLWEEKFEVVAAGTPGASASHLTATMVEAWCMDHLRVPVKAAPADRTFVLTLEWFVPDDNDQGGETTSGLTLTALIDRLSRKAREAPNRWRAVSAPLRLRDLNDRTRR